jgi:hypothetical protein
MFTEALFIIGEKWKQPGMPTTEKSLNKCVLSIQWNIVQQSKPMNYLDLEKITLKRW